MRALALLFALAFGCGGSAEGDLDQGGSAGSGGSAGAAGRAGTEGGSGGSGAGASGGSSAGGSSSGSGGSSSGSGGSSSGSGGSTGGPPGYEECLTTCTTIAELPCPGDQFDVFECLKNCDELGTRGATCDAAYAAAYRCFVKEVPLKCDGQGKVKIACGPCDPQLSQVAAECAETEIECAF